MFVFPCCAVCFSLVVMVKKKMASAIFSVSFFLNRTNMYCPVGQATTHFLFCCCTCIRNFGFGFCTAYQLPSKSPASFWHTLSNRKQLTLAQPWSGFFLFILRSRFHGQKSILPSFQKHYLTGFWEERELVWRVDQGRWGVRGGGAGWVVLPR